MADLPEFASRMNFKGGSAARNAKGQFKSITHAELRAISDSWAKRVQARAVQNMAGSYVRPLTRTNRLLKVTADSSNRVSDRFGFAVGIEDYLNRSQAKYWRTIEEGSAATWAGGMIGLVLPFGRWGSSLTGWYSNKWGEQPLAGPKYGGRGGKLRPFSKRVRAQIEAGGGERAVVSKEIAPHHYYKRAFEDMNVGPSFEKEAVEILRRAATMGLYPPQL